MQKAIQFKNSYGLTLRGLLTIPKKYDTAVILLHGFPSSYQGFTLPRIAHKLLKVLLLRFDFSHSNTSDGKFEDKLISKEVKDIKYAIDFLEKNDYDIKVLYLKVNLEELISRIKKRNRPDDNIEIFKKRMEIFNSEKDVILGMFKDKVIEISGNGTIEEIGKQIFTLI